MQRQRGIVKRCGGATLVDGREFIIREASMKSIEFAILSKYQDARKYQSIGDGVYQDLENKRYVISLRFELEEGDSTQYPLEDVLDKYYVNCTDHIVEREENSKRILEVEIEDGNDENYESLDTIKEIASFVGKRIYNKKVDGYIELMIE